MEAEAPKPTTLLGWIREHKLRCVGGVWAGGISGALTYNMLFKPGACGAWRESKGGRWALCSVIVSCLLEARAATLRSDALAHLFAQHKASLSA